MRPSAGSGWVCSRAAVSRSSPRVRVAVTPAWVNSARRVMVGVAAAAVCEAAARRPAAERPASTVSNGIRRATRRAVRENTRGLPNDSKCSRARSVLPSHSHHRSRSLLLTSRLSPSETKLEMPMPRRDSPSRSAMPTPPDCTAIPAVPGVGLRTANVASRWTDSSVLAMPRQLGPTSRIPQWRQAVVSSAVRLAPRPDVTTTKAPTPALPHWAAVSGTAAAGTARTARSGG